MKKLAIILGSLVLAGSCLAASLQINDTIQTIAITPLALKQSSDRADMTTVTWNLGTENLVGQPVDSTEVEKFFVEGTPGEAINMNVALSSDANLLGMSNVYATVTHFVTGASATAGNIMNDKALALGGTDAAEILSTENPVVEAGSTDTATSYNSTSTSEYIANYYEYTLGFSDGTTTEKPTEDGNFTGSVTLSVSYV